MSMPTTDGMANSVMSRGMEAVPIRSTLSSPADEARNRSPRGSPAAWASTPSSALALRSCALFQFPVKLLLVTHAFAPFFSSALL